MTSGESITSAEFYIHQNELHGFGGVNCYMVNKCKTEIPKGLVIVYHGMGGHTSSPTTKYALELFYEAGYAVVAYDFPGHGRSEGLPGYLKSADDLIEVGSAMAIHAMSLYDSGVPPFICGSSMGGAIALLVADRLGVSHNIFPGLILMAPMLKLDVSALEHTGLKFLAWAAPTVRMIPTNATDMQYQYRDPKKIEECLNDPYSGDPGAKIRTATALTCVNTALRVSLAFDKIKNPYLLLIADEDVVVNNEGSEEFHRTSPSQDKTKIHYPALHCIMCEPEPLFGKIKTDILEWTQQRISQK